MKIRALALCLGAILVALASHAVPDPTTVASVAPVPASLSAEALQTAASATEVARLIGVFEARVKEHADALDYQFLGKLYLQRARSTGDIGSYSQAQAALERALALYPDDPDSQAAFARLRYAMHDFTGAAHIAVAGLAADPSDVAATAILGDSALELGDYVTAGETFAALSRRFPNAAAVDGRLARLSFLRGDAARARELADRAYAEARGEGTFGADLAWYAHLRAQTRFDTGDYAAAAAFERDALAIAPDYYVAEAGLARATAALGQIDDAIALYQRAIDAVPQPEYLAAVGDLRAFRGDPALAKHAYDAVDLSASLVGLTARLYDRQFALFDIDHEQHLDEALAIATASLAQRPDVYGYDIYAWALYGVGRYAEATAASDRALVLGTPDARLHYHAGLIALARGETVRARTELVHALTIGPAFDPLLAQRARATVREIEVLR